MAVYERMNWTVDVSQLPKDATAPALQIAYVDVLTEAPPLTYSLAYVQPDPEEVLVCLQRCTWQIGLLTFCLTEC